MLLALAFVAGQAFLVACLVDKVDLEPCECPEFLAAVDSIDWLGDGTPAPVILSEAGARGPIALLNISTDDPDGDAEIIASTLETAGLTRGPGYEPSAAFSSEQWFVRIESDGPTRKSVSITLHAYAGTDRATDAIAPLVAIFNR